MDSNTEFANKLVEFEKKLGRPLKEEEIILASNLTKEHNGDYTIALTVLAGVLLLNSEESKAGASDIAEKIAKPLFKQFTNLIESLMGTLQDAQKLFMEEGTQKQAVAVAKEGDAVNEYERNIHNKTIAHKAAPPANVCNIDRNIKEAKVINEFEATKTGQLLKSHMDNVTSTWNRGISTKAQLITKKTNQIKRIIEASSGSDAVQKTLSIGSADNQRPSNGLAFNEYEEKRALENLNIVLESNAAIPNIDNLSNPAQVEMAISSASHLFQQQHVMKPFLKDISQYSIDSKTGKSKAQITDERLNNTYYSEQFRAELDAHIEAAPLLKSIALQQANHLSQQVEQLQTQKDISKTLALILKNKIG